MKGTRATLIDRLSRLSARNMDWRAERGGKRTFAMLALSAALLVAFTSTGSVASARATSNAHTKKAAKLETRGALEQACAEREAAFKALPSATTQFAFASCKEKEGRLEEAWNAFQKATEIAKREKKVTLASRAARRRDAIEGRLGQLLVELPSMGIDNVAITLDGEPLDARYQKVGTTTAGPRAATPLTSPPFISPGNHVLFASLAGHQPAQLAIEIAPGAKRTIRIPDLEPESRGAVVPAPDAPDAPETPEPREAQPTRPSPPNELGVRAASQNGMEIYNAANGNGGGWMFVSMLSVAWRPTPRFDIQVREGYANGASPAGARGNVLSNPSLGVAYEIGGSDDALTITPGVLVAAPLGGGGGDNPDPGDAATVARARRQALTDFRPDHLSGVASVNVAVKMGGGRVNLAAQPAYSQSSKLRGPASKTDDEISQVLVRGRLSVFLVPKHLEIVSRTIVAVYLTTPEVVALEPKARSVLISSVGVNVSFNAVTLSTGYRRNLTPPNSRGQLGIFELGVESRF